jgi:hypothetical protein
VGCTNPVFALQTKQVHQLQSNLRTPQGYRLFGWQSDAEAARALNSTEEQVTRWRSGAEPMAFADFLTLTSMIGVAAAEAMRGGDARIADLSAAAEALGVSSGISTWLVRPQSRPLSPPCWAAGVDGREDARPRQRERNEQRSHRADGATVSRCARPVGVSKRQQD